MVAIRKPVLRVQYAFFNVLGFDFFSRILRPEKRREDNFVYCVHSISPAFLPRDFIGVQTELGLPETECKRIECGWAPRRRIPKVNKNTPFLINCSQGIFENVGLAAKTIFNNHVLDNRGQEVFLRFRHVVNDVIEPLERPSYDRKTLGRKEMPGCQDEG